jgi:hypothetical protein
MAIKFAAKQLLKAMTTIKLSAVAMCIAILAREPLSKPADCNRCMQKRAVDDVE